MLLVGYQVLLFAPHHVLRYLWLQLGPCICPQMATLYPYFNKFRYITFCSVINLPHIGASPVTHNPLQLGDVHPLMLSLHPRKHFIESPNLKKKKEEHPCIALDFHILLHHWG